MKYFGGIDIGSTTTELVVTNEDKKIVFQDKTFTSGNISLASKEIMEKCLDNLGITMNCFERITATGYGRKQVEFAHNNVTEISCYAKGAFALSPLVRTVIDIGGQDSKVITVLDNGDVDEFVMNDKCAAGTGRFLEMVSRIFCVNIDQMGELSLKSNNIIPISSICAVFAESEIISLIAKEVKSEDIIHSVHNSIAEKIKGMASRLRCNNHIMFCGGVARNVGMVKAIKDLFNTEEIIVPQNSDFVGAYGAAVIASNN